MNATKPRVAIIIPARYHSTRLPGKPLMLIAGQTMIERVWSIAQTARKGLSQAVNIDVVVTSEDERITDYCSKLQIPAILTSNQCPTGTARVAEAARKLETQPDFVINLQGDNALCPPWFLQAILNQYLEDQTPGVVTPYVRLSWVELDKLLLEKQSTPFSGTTVVFNKTKKAYWFSKNIIPAIRSREILEKASPISPVARHIGIYGYEYNTLLKIQQLKTSHYETLEGLEQLTFLEAGIHIQMVEVSYQGRQGMTGVDSAEDIQRAESIISQDGEFE